MSRSRFDAYIRQQKLERLKKERSSFEKDAKRCWVCRRTPDDLLTEFPSTYWEHNTPLYHEVKIPGTNIVGESKWMKVPQYLVGHVSICHVCVSLIKEYSKPPGSFSLTTY